MLSRVEGFQPGLDGRRDPFDQHPDLARSTLLFIYLTGRGQFSYLIEGMTEHEIIREAERTIPMGYTQIWVLQWASAVRPEYGREASAEERQATGELRQDRPREDHSYVLLGENARNFGWTGGVEAATRAARAIAAKERVRVAIGLLKNDVTWH